jgi:cytochrome c553
VDFVIFLQSVKKDFMRQSISRRLPHRIALYSVIGLAPLLGGIGCSERASTAQPGAQKAVVCLACHGADGNGPDPAVPKLANQNLAYLANAMKSYADGRRNHESMKTFVAGLSEADIRDIAAFYSSQPAR